MKRAVWFVALLAALPAATPQMPGPRGYYRFPAVFGDRVVFTAEGDLWTVSIAGGTAQRLTSHPGEETNAAISPDGRTVAFSASYEGPTDVYTMPLAGGLPTRRTYDGGASVVGWTGDGHVLYATRLYSTLPNTQLVRLDTTNDRRDLVPLSQAADGVYDSAGTLYFTRQRFQGSNTRRYQGGTAPQLWKLAPGAAEATPLTADYPGTSRSPMLWQGRVYFISDRDGTMNLWSIAPDGSDPRELTHQREFDIRGAALSDGRIVYQLGADLRVVTIATGEDHEIPITLASDLDQTRERWVTTPMDYLTSAHVSPDGDRVALTARGEVFVASVGDGRLVDASHTPGVRYRSARFAPDGQSLYALSDQTGETEWWSLPANGIGASERLTDSAAVLRFDGVMSPDGQHLAFADKNQDLWVWDLRTRRATRIESDSVDLPSDLTWSPDSKWLVYTEPNQTFSRLVLYSMETGRATPITSERVDSYAPAWSPDGKWLYFLSDRNFQSLVDGPWGPRAPEPFFDRQTKIYQLALRSGLRSPFRAADEVEREDSVRAAAHHAAADSTHAAARPARRGHAAPAADSTRADSTARDSVRIELDGLPGRLFEVPVPAGDYGNLAVTATRVLWLSSPAGSSDGATLLSLEIKPDAGAPVHVLDGVRLFEVSADGKKALVRVGDDLHVIDAASGAAATLGPHTKVDLTGWALHFAPRDEWRQMFAEAWRLERDYFYDRGMNGADWAAVERQYAPLVDRVTSRAELSDVIAQMVSNLSALHTFVYGGDMRQGADQVQVASLGAMLAPDSAAGGWRVAHVYQADPDFPDQIGPLQGPDVDVRDGDVIQMIDGTATLSVPDPAALLRNEAGRPVRLRVLPQGRAPARDVMVTPVSAGRAAGLRYGDWELSRRRWVDSAAQQQIGYVHLRAMGSGDMAQWTRDFYPVFNRQGLIIDVRHNGGGNIDSWILSRLLRRAWMYWQPRVGRPYWNMQWAFRGHIVVLVDEWTASDGEAFAEGFRRLGLGRIIGTRTWGGEIWLTSSNVLVDHGIATAAEFGVYGPEGAWLIERHGVDPDSVVDDLPVATFHGRDAQLEAATAYLEREIREHPVPVPAAPAYPTPARRP